MNNDFFSLSIRQPINQWLCIGLMVSWCVWVLIHYVGHEITTVDARVSARNAILTDQLK
jgi:multidrug resistance efflux pump